MRTISVEELHEKTGHWLRRLAEEEQLVVTEQGRPIARLLLPLPKCAGNPFSQRQLLPGVAELIHRPVTGAESTEIISEMRDEQ